MDHFLYKYVKNDEIIYIGRTSNIVKRIAAHNMDLPTGCDVYFGVCPNTATARASELLLIDLYRPRFNVEGVYANEPMNTETTVWEPKWIKFTEDIKKEFEKAAIPTDQQQNRAKNKYQKYCDKYDDIKKRVPWEEWIVNIKTQKDYSISNSSATFFDFCNGHKFDLGETIPWKIIADWMSLYLTDLKDQYLNYVRYASERDISPQSSIFDLDQIKIWLDTIIDDYDSAKAEYKSYITELTNKNSSNTKGEKKPIVADPYEEEFICPICLQQKKSWPCNPEPLFISDDSTKYVCCTDCDEAYVNPLRTILLSAELNKTSQYHWLPKQVQYTISPGSGIFVPSAVTFSDTIRDYLIQFLTIVFPSKKGYFIDKSLVDEKLEDAFAAKLFYMQGKNRGCYGGHNFNNELSEWLDQIFHDKVALLKGKNEARAKESL